MSQMSKPLCGAAHVPFGAAPAGSATLLFGLIQSAFLRTRRTVLFLVSLLRFVFWNCSLFVKMQDHIAFQ